MITVIQIKHYRFFRIFQKMIDISENDVRQPSGRFSLKRRRLRRDSFFQIKSTKIKGKYVHFAKIKKLYSPNFCVSPKSQLQESLLKCLLGKASRKGGRRAGAAPGTPATYGPAPLQNHTGRTRGQEVTPKIQGNSGTG